MNTTNSKPVADDGTKATTKLQKEKATIKFLTGKKKEMKESQYRRRFDALRDEIDLNLVNTNVAYGQKMYEKTSWGSMVFYNKMANGAYDINIYPQKINNRDQNRSGVPIAQEPIAFSKIMIATSVLAGKLPDAQVISDDKVFSKAVYELWKRTWLLKGGNGENTLWLTYFNLLCNGWAAWRVYPRKVQVKRNGVDKILFDDIYREPMDPRRTWLGIGVNNGDYWSQFEVYYEKDMLKEEFYAKYPEAKKYAKKLEYVFTTSDESKEENQELSRKSVTIGYYENVLLNRYIVACGQMVIYDGELPNDDSYGSVVVAKCMVRDVLDPYGVGLYELMRGNTAMYTYINSLNAQQVEAEIFPLLFGTQVQNGTATYKRSPNVINPKNPGTSIDVVHTSGNVQQGIAYANQQKIDIEENTGVNNIIAGQSAENTLGSTVILKEASQTRLTPSKNSMMNGLQTDAHITTSWIKQTYPADKVFLIDSQEHLAEFVKQNPDYFIESEEVIGDDGIPTGSFAVVASPNLRINFDFTPDGQIMEDVEPRVISERGFFKEMEETGHTSPYYEFIIDPNSMLAPSIEIQKQTFMALFPVITNQLNMIFEMRMIDPPAAAAQLKALEQLLNIQQENVFDYIPKQQYDEIMSMQPAQPPQPEDDGKKPTPTINYKDTPEDIKRQIEEQAGLTPSQDPSFNTTAKQTVNRPGVSSDPNASRTRGPNQIARPQSPMGSSVDASLGRAAFLPFK